MKPVDQFFVPAQVIAIRIYKLKRQQPGRPAAALASDISKMLPLQFMLALGT
jgi:hypothetical protein